MRRVGVGLHGNQTHTHQSPSCYFMYAIKKRKERRKMRQMTKEKLK